MLQTAAAFQALSKMETFLESGGADGVGARVREHAATWLPVQPQSLRRPSRLRCQCSGRTAHAQRVMAQAGARGFAPSANGDALQQIPRLTINPIPYSELPQD
jgi:hypothetical protein